MTRRPATPALTRDELDQALCTQSDPEAWFPDIGGSARAAVAVCARCPIQARCLAVALSLPNDLDGVWGGTTPNQRRALRRRLNRQTASTTTEQAPGTRPAAA